MPPPDPEIQALRTAAAATRLGHIHALRLSGPGALALVDHLTTSRLFMRESQMVNTLMLDPAGAPWADVLLAQDEDSLIALIEGPTLADLLAHLEAVRRGLQPTPEVQVANLLDDHVLWGIDGPFAWEVVSRLAGPEVLGAPYLSFLQLGDLTCFRAGKTGEYGYLLLVPAAGAAARWEQLLALGHTQGLLEASLASLDQCALENWHFSMRVLSQVDPGLQLTPLELQLQWRVDYSKEFVGAAAVRARRASPQGRVTCFVAPGEVRPGAEVTRGREVVGTVLAAQWSSVRAEWVGWALLARRLAWPGIEFQVASGAAAITMQTRSPPVINNRSLYVDPHRHSFQTRQTDTFPPLVLA